MQGSLQIGVGWIKIENHTLTVDELVWLNNHILAEVVVYKVDGYEKSDTRRG
ncbi:hypothetical protein P7H19_24630 [Paenibacillus larvae]|nr:hypothetical protein [Paenibacillus larvae]MDT2238823.1 hypothetical protein [Paenibacillus larvae]